MQTSGMKKTSAVFFGTGPVAAACLERLLAHTEIEAIVTKPAKNSRDATPVLDVAAEHDIKTILVTNKQTLDEAIDQYTFKSEYAILIDFGIIVSQSVIDTFKYGIVNSHFSLLPALRGADPITFAILEGHTKTGVSLMLVDKGMDTGKLIAQRTHHLAGTETTPELTNALIALSDELLQEHIPRYLKGLTMPHNQPHPDRATYTRKLTKADGQIDWHKPATTLEREVRAFSGWPGSRTTIAGSTVTIIEASAVSDTNTPGTISATKKSLSVATAEGSLQIHALKPAGKKEMPIAAFLSGYGSRL